MGAPAKSQPKESKRQLPEKGPKPKKTKFEKSIETICTSFAQCSEDEMKRYEDLEKQRHERELQYRLELQKLESDRRREERQHELNILQILTQTRGYNSAPYAMAHHYGNTASPSSSFSSENDHNLYQF
ncbi:hypothetical protein ACROYT_G036294 [Oculina patagonica]